MRTAAKIALLLIPFLSLVAVWSAGGGAGAPPGIAAAPGLAEAERLFAEGSFARALAIYRQMDAEELPEDDARWVKFRLADAAWRSQASTATADPTGLERAREALEAIVREAPRPEDRGRRWAEAQESLGDFWWTRRESRNWGRAWSHYQEALDWWGGATDIELARGRYLGMVWRMAHPPHAEPYYTYGYHGNTLPPAILENALAIARGADDRAHASFLLAMALRYEGGDLRQARRVPTLFEAALQVGRGTGWYDDALYHYAEWRQQRGPVTVVEGGGVRSEPDFVGALALYRRLLAEFPEGESRWVDPARSAVEEITGPAVGVAVSNIFLPGSEVEVHLSWRNVGFVRLALYSVDLTADLSLAGSGERAGGWLDHIELAGRPASRSWEHDTRDRQDHRPGSAALRLDPPPSEGAWVLEASARGKHARELILVTDAALVLKGTGERALLFFGDAITGAPVADAAVRLWERSYTGGSWAWTAHDGRTGADGLAVFELDPRAERGRRELVAAAVRGRRQALVPGRSVHHSREGASWRIQAITDRPAYRPGETAQWKLIARQREAGAYRTPAGETLEYRIDDPRGATVQEGAVVLNDFGSAWGALDLASSMPLGEYRVQFWTAGKRDRVGGATLFRLEEYKLPEFRVAVRVPEEDGRRKTFRLGEAVEVEIAADYYFGGPVADASVEVLVRQSPFALWWAPPRPYPWLYEDMERRPYSYGHGGSVVKRETLRTDARGRATLRFETPEGSGQELEYRIEARVMDASRREVVGTDQVRVTRQRYYVHPRPRHNLHRPGDRVTIDFAAVDANSQPVQASGVVTVTREYWFEIWIDPEGNEVRGEELEAIRSVFPIFPPPPRRPGGPGWQLKASGTEHDEILVRTVATDAVGSAELSFTPEREGIYRVAWESRDDDGSPILAETAAWVATRESRDLGYRHGGVQILADRDTFRTGETAPVLISVPTNDRHVLFTVEAEGILSYQVIHVPGMVKLVELPIGPEHVPNVFLSASMISDAQMWVDTQQVIVPPERQFLDVTLEYDRSEYRPREEGTVTIRTSDHRGLPVPAEVSLGVVDESVFYIQQDYAGDPRRFFHGDKRGNAVQTTSTFHLRGYAKLMAGEDGRLIDARAGGITGGGEREEDQRVLGGLGSLALEEGRDDQAGFRQKSAARSEVAADEALSLPAAAPAEPGGGPAVEVRSDFRATMFWGPDVRTGEDGRAEVAVRFPDSLTTWRATARAAGRDSRVGFAEGSAVASKPLIVRLQAPRFFVVGDEATISAVMNNHTGRDLTVRPAMNASGVELLGVVRNGSIVRGDPDLVTIPAGGERRVDWQVAARRPGKAEVTVEAAGGNYSDAMRRALPVHEHGIEKLLTAAGKVRGAEARFTLNLPAEHRPGSASLVLRVAPSLAVTLLDALPYLIDYPYGCTEQTMSRFLPAVITARTLRDLGISPEAAMSTVFGGIEPGTATETDPGGPQGLAELDAVVREGLERLYDFQHADGGWAWWKEGDSDHFMSAYVVWGLALARDAGIAIRGEVLDRGVAFLAREIVELEDAPDLAAFLLHALAVEGRAAAGGDAGRFAGAALDRLWDQRAALNAYTRSLLALAAHHLGDAERARTLVRNLENGVRRDDTPDTSVVQRGAQESRPEILGTAHWGEDGIFHRWSDGGVEATAFALRALLAVEPDHELVEPVMNWLVKNRRGAQWSNTRDTAMVVLSLNDYLRVSGELAGDVEYELLVNGRSLARRRVTQDAALGAPGRFDVPVELLRDGANEVRVVRHGGEGALYFAAEMRFFSLEEPVPPAGNEIFARRQYYRLVGRPTLLKGYVYERVPVNDGEIVRSGERVEVVLTLEAKNHYEYLVFEDLKPAGLEAVQLRSGEPLFARELRPGAVEARLLAEEPGGLPPASGPDGTGRSRWVHQELRDRKVALFLDRLPEGVWEVRYELRAEVPGRFHALPVAGHAMYVPEIRCNGREIRITLEDVGSDLDLTPGGDDLAPRVGG